MTKGDRIGAKWIELTKQDQIGLQDQGEHNGPKWTNWTGQNQSGLNRTKVDRMDRIEPI